MLVADAYDYDCENCESLNESDPLMEDSFGFVVFQCIYYAHAIYDNKYYTNYIYKYEIAINNFEENCSVLITTSEVDEFVQAFKI